MKKVILTKGLPASGKSTWAKNMVAEYGYKRINKDDLRAMVDCSKWNKENEKLILECRNKMLITFLNARKNVIIDDGNFEQKHWTEIKGIVDMHNLMEIRPKEQYQMEEKFFDATVEECIARDSKREGVARVGEKVIRDMYDRYLKPKADTYSPDPRLPRAIICDLDGTLALLNGREPYNPITVMNDEVNEPVRMILSNMLSKGEIIFISGRFEKYRGQTTEWLIRAGFKNCRLLMRADEDTRKDSIIKREIFDKHIRGYYNVICVFDDRNQVVEMWRQLGLTCFQVAYGNF